MAKTADKKNNNQSVEAFAKRIADGEQLSDPKDLQFYENNKAEIEAKLKEMVKKVSKNDDAGSGNKPADSGGGSGQPSADQQSSIPYDPLGEPVNEKVYAGQPAAGGQQERVIPEHSFNQPPGEDVNNQFNQQYEQQGSQQQQQKSEPRTPYNPDMKDATKREQEQGAEQLAEVIFMTMGQLYQGVNKFVMIPEKKVERLQREGKIDVRVNVPYKTGVAPISTVFSDHNSKAKNLITVDDDWKQAVKPALVEELQKAGHGLSNRQFLIYMFSTKLASDGYKVAQFYALQKDYLKFAQEQTAMQRFGTSTRPAAQPPLQKEQPEPVLQGNVVDEEVLEGEGTTLQEQALNKVVIPGSVYPKFGKVKSLKNLDKMSKQNSKLAGRKSSAKNIVRAAKQKVLEVDPPPTGQPKPKGRPKGSKNRPKKK